MTRRYFAPDISLAGGAVELTDKEAHHAMHVMRVQRGDSIVLFDGNGHEADASVIAISRNGCLCQSEHAKAIDREPNRQLHLGIALPKPDRARELIERLTELGVRSITPLRTSRTQRPPSSSLLDRLRLGSIEACKQSGRNFLPRINAPTEAGDFFAVSDPAAARWIADPSGSPIGSLIDTADDHLIGAVGPEGGWTAEELAQAKMFGFIVVGLGKRILRVETAATLMAARLLD